MRLSHRGMSVAEQVRCWSRKQGTFDPLHSLALLGRKPGALDYARPLAGWPLPGAFAVLRQRLGEVDPIDLREGGEAMTAQVPAAAVVLLKHRRVALHLPTVKAECEPVARQCVSENIDYLGFLLRLCERELGGRERRACARRLKAARFPQVQSLNEFDYTAQPLLNRALIVELSRCEVIDRRESGLPPNPPLHLTGAERRLSRVQGLTGGPGRGVLHER